MQFMILLFGSHKKGIQIEQKFGSWKKSLKAILFYMCLFYIRFLLYYVHEGAEVCLDSQAESCVPLEMF